MCQSHSIIYWSNTTDYCFQTVLTINPDRRGVLKVGSNRDMRYHPAGLFEALIPQHLFNSVMMKTGGPDFVNSHSQVSLIPGESFREIKVIAKDNLQILKLVGEELKTPAPFADVEYILKGSFSTLKKIRCLL